DFTSPTYRGGDGKVYARSGVTTGYGRLGVVLKKVVSDPASTSLPADPGSKFGGGADAARNPDVVYPNDGVILPPNLGSIEVHFLPGASNTLFEIDFSNDVTDIRVFARCATPLGGGCIYSPQGGVWTWLSTTNGGRPRSRSRAPTTAAASSASRARSPCRSRKTQSTAASTTGPPTAAA